MDEHVGDQSAAVVSLLVNTIAPAEDGCASELARDHVLCETVPNCQHSKRLLKLCKC